MVDSNHSNVKGLAEALTILAKYEPDSSYCFEHDQMWACRDTLEGMSDEDKKRLGELGWFHDEESWSKFA